MPLRSHSFLWQRHSTRAIPEQLSIDVCTVCDFYHLTVSAQFRKGLTPFQLMSRSGSVHRSTLIGVQLVHYRSFDHMKCTALTAIVFTAVLTLFGPLAQAQSLRFGLSNGQPDSAYRPFGRAAEAVDSHPFVDPVDL